MSFKNSLCCVNSVTSFLMISFVYFHNYFKYTCLTFFSFGFLSKINISSFSFLRSATDDSFHIYDVQGLLLDNRDRYVINYFLYKQIMEKSSIKFYQFL